MSGKVLNTFLCLTKWFLYRECPIVIFVACICYTSTINVDTLWGKGKVQTMNLFSLYNEKCYCFVISVHTNQLHQNWRFRGKSYTRDRDEMLPNVFFILIESISQSTICSIFGRIGSSWISIFYLFFFFLYNKILLIFSFKIVFQLHLMSIPKNFTI